LEAGDHHALFTFTRNPSARAKLIRDLVKAGFDVSSFGESTRALEEAYFAQVKSRETAA
jgi:ABC-2 type transport system ATP-binding protein